MAFAIKVNGNTHSVDVDGERSKQPDRPQVPIRSRRTRGRTSAGRGPGSGAIFQRDDPDRPAGHWTIACLTRRARL
jgi:hypothetical protein